MEKQNRRNFLKKSCAAGLASAALSTNVAQAESKHILSADRMGVLVDTTACIGCRKCEWACKKAHGNEDKPITAYEDTSVLDFLRRPNTQSYSIINKFDTADLQTKPVYVKTQCMHCDYPSCVSACIVSAFTKQENGSVLWNTDKCIGCRYCMVACPFQVPSFEYGKAVEPNVEKCDFCIERIKNEQLPACVEICPVEALTYGRRADLLKVARDKIHRSPERYINHIYGEREVGGTSWMYLAGVEFSTLGLPNFESRPMPGTTESIQHAIFAYFVPPISLYALLGTLMWITKRRKDSTE